MEHWRTPVSYFRKESRTSLYVVTGIVFQGMTSSPVVEVTKAYLLIFARFEIRTLPSADLVSVDGRAQY